MPDINSMLPKNVPNWACLPAAFSIILGMDFHDFVNEIGHDGSGKVYQDKTINRGFHIQECIDVISRLGYSCTPIEFRYANQARPGVNDIFEIPFSLARQLHYMTTTARGVLQCGKKKSSGKMIGHAVAYINPVVIDPATKLCYPWENTDSYGLFVGTLWKVAKNV